MANALYVKGAERMWAALLGTLPVAGTLKVALVKNTYPQSLTADEFYTEISAYVVGTPQTIGSIATTGGKLDGADVTFTAVAAGDTCEGVVIYMDTGVAGTSWLLAYIDTITSFPVATNGGDIVVAWDNGTYKIISLV